METKQNLPTLNLAPPPLPPPEIASAAVTSRRSSDELEISGFASFRFPLPDLLLVSRKPSPKASDLAKTEASSTALDLSAQPSNRFNFEMLLREKFGAFGMTGEGKCAC
ncbi:hypothetical protein COLO4_37745 [Corchorus olitorius]|uniref:Uncharacterized protein n=1 Tax=Corchorus olitorius TaxID=93759 RepID=A0A1R3FZK9_9ROSI|nr:hypothetical protein COLO4_37745 [Corchorus olitorius]